MITDYSKVKIPPQQGVALSKLARSMHVKIYPLKDYMREVCQWPDVVSSDIVPMFMAETVKTTYSEVEVVPFEKFDIALEASKLLAAHPATTLEKS